MEGLPRKSEAKLREQRGKMRERYSVHYSKLSLSNEIEIEPNKHEDDKRESYGWSWSINSKILDDDVEDD